MAKYEIIDEYIFRADVDNLLEFVCATPTRSLISTLRQTHIYIYKRIYRRASEKKATFEKIGLVGFTKLIQNVEMRMCLLGCVRVCSMYTHILHMNVCLYLNSISSSALHDLFIILFNFVTTGRTKEEKNPTSGKTI